MMRILTTQRLALVMVAMGACSLSMPAEAAITYDDNVTPGIIFGSGNLNGGFTIDRDNNVELGLRGKLRHNGDGDPENTWNSNNDGSYTFQAGIGPTPNSPPAPPHSAATAEWSFEWSINSDKSSGSTITTFLSAYTYKLSLSGPSGSDKSFDPINGVNDGLGSVVQWDHAIGTNDFGFVASIPNSSVNPTTIGAYAALINGQNVAQNSWKPHWIIPGFDPETLGVYTISLEAFDGTTSKAKTEITIKVVPEPMSISLLGIGMIGLVGFGRPRHRRIA